MQFLYPNVLLLMLIPALIFIYLLYKQKNSFELYFSKIALERLLVDNSALSLKTRNILLFISLFFMIIALSRPVVDKKEQKIEQELIPIVVAIDVSKSMLATDIYPNRLTMAKKKLEGIIKNSRKSAIGVLFFAKSPFILSPITEDFASLLSMVENIDSGVNFDNGSNIMPTLEASSELLKDYQNKNLIILSDGGNKDEYKSEINFAKSNNISISIIAIATKNSVAIPDKNGYLSDKNGKIITVKINENIKELAFNTGGGYIEYSLNNSDVKQIIDHIENNSNKDKFDSKKIKTYNELFYFPLALSILLLLIAFSSLPQIKKVALIVLVLSINNSDLKASLLNFKTIENAKKSYEIGDYKNAIKEYENATENSQTYYNLANSYYKNGEYEKALENYKKVISDDKDLEYKKLHNMGNSYAYLNKFDDAIKMYEKALNIKENKETEENLEEIKKLIDKKNQKQNQDNKQQNDDKQKDENKNQDEKKDKQNNKNEQNKDKENSDKNSEQKEKQKKEEKEQKAISENKNDEKENKDNQQAQQQKQLDELKESEISNIEEKKWMEILKNQKTPSLLRKFDTKSSADSEENPY